MCSDVPGIEWVRVAQLTLLQPGRVVRKEAHQADDLLASWEDTGSPMMIGTRLVAAGFRVKILGCATPRLVTIRPSNRAQYTRDVDRAWIERWLQLRGFTRRKGGSDDAGTEAVLAVA